jgi:phytoene dehydrogenase-like protein
VSATAGPGEQFDVVVIGAGPNGLAAAIALSRAGLSTLVVEARSTPGGGTRTEQSTLPGLLHDVCSTVHPLGAASPFFRSLGLQRFGLEWIESPAPLVHLLNDGTTVTLERSLQATAARLGADGAAYRRLLEPFVERFDPLMRMVLGPLHAPEEPFLLARFGLLALQSMRALARRNFEGQAAAALLGGISAHAMLPLDAAATASFALVLAAAGHAVGWPIARGGSGAIARALSMCLEELGGKIRVNQPIAHLHELPRARAYVFDVTPRQLLEIAGSALPEGYRRRLARFRYGPGVFKMDWALSQPIPWKQQECARACTVHLSGDLDQVNAAEAAAHAGGVARYPFVLLVQPSLFDPTRGSANRHTAWAYCHVPHGSDVDASEAIESHIERYAPGFRDIVLARATKNALDMQSYNANYVGGDINGGLATLGQLFFRPVARLDPYATPAPHIFLCSSSTPPGGGVHGMCGYWAARQVAWRVFGRRIATETSSPGAKLAGGAINDRPNAT